MNYNMPEKKTMEIEIIRLESPEGYAAIRCVMCGNLAQFIAMETEEFLCKHCVANNNEARMSK